MFGEAGVQRTKRTREKPGFPAMSGYLGKLGRSLECLAAMERIELARSRLKSPCEMIGEFRLIYRIMGPERLGVQNASIERL
jgi:hypothetical protein